MFSLAISDEAVEIGQISHFSLAIPVTRPGNGAEAAKSGHSTEKRQPRRRGLP